jgi:hypothetical protein
MSTYESTANYPPVSFLRARPKTLFIKADEFEPGHSLANYFLAVSLQPSGRSEELVTLSEGSGITRVADGWTVSFTGNQTDRTEGSYDLVIQVFTAGYAWEREIIRAVRITPNRLKTA